MFPPFIKGEESEVEVREGDIGLISCEVVGNPVPHIKWFREGLLNFLLPALFGRSG